MRHYKLEDNAASTAVVDSAGNANGVSARNTNLMTVAGKITLGFDSTTAGDGINTGSDVVGTGADTICGWFSADTKGLGTSYGRLFDNGKTQCYMNNSTTQIACASNGATAITASSCLSTTLQHVCFARSATGAAVIYCNGASTGSGASGTPASGTGNLFIGSNTAAGQSLDGKLDDIRVFSKQLSSAEVAAIYNAGTGTQSDTLEGDAVATAYDISGNGLSFTTTAYNRRALYTGFTGSGRVLTFDGVNDGYASTTILSSVVGASAKTIIIVAETTDNNQDHRFLSDGQNYFDTVIDDSDNQIDISNSDAGGADVLSVTIVPGSLWVLQATHDGVNLRARVNLGAWVTTASGATADVTNALTIGDTDMDTINGKLAELIVFNKVITDDVLDKIVRNYLGRKWGIGL